MTLTPAPASDISAFRMMADSLPQIVFIQGADGAMEFWNQRWYDYTGLSVEQSMGPERYNMNHPDDHQQLLEKWPQCRAAGMPFDLELRVRRASDGEYRWHLARAVPLRDKSGAIVRWYGTLTDIDDQKRVQDGLRLLADAGVRLATARDISSMLGILAQEVIERFADWCSIYEAVPGSLPRAVSIVHKDPAKIKLAQTLIEEFPIEPTDLTMLVIASGEPVLLEKIDDALVRERTKNQRHYELIKQLGLRSAMVVPIKSGETVLGVLSLISAESTHRFNGNDFVLAQALAQRAGLAWSNVLLLRNSVEAEQRFRIAAETIPDMLWVAGPDGALRYANARWTEFFGSETELQTWRMRDHVHPEDIERAYSRWQHSLQSGDPYEVEYRARNQHGEYKWFLARALPLRDSTGALIEWFGTTTSIDEQVAALERQRMVADTLQDLFIPKSIPEIDGVSYDGAYLAAQEEARVGGDWYGATTLDPDCSVFSIGDVCGHGVGAAVTMGRVRQAILANSVQTRDPAIVLERVNRLMQIQGAPIVTAIVGFINMAEGTIIIAGAGHPPAVVVQNDKVEFFGKGGLPLAVSDHPNYVAQTIKITDSTFIGLYTDGLIEARRDVMQDEALTIATMREAARTRLSATEIRERVLQDTPSNDDVAVLTIRITPRA